MELKYNAIRPKLWEVVDPDGKKLGRIRHILNADNIGWMASDGKVYRTAKEAAQALAATA